jgi:hypothetical protein
MFCSGPDSARGVESAFFARVEAPNDRFPWRTCGIRKGNYKHGEWDSVASAGEMIVIKRDMEKEVKWRSEQRSSRRKLSYTTIMATTLAAILLTFCWCARTPAKAQSLADIDHVVLFMQVIISHRAFDWLFC